ncbi:MAG: hypothetical protein ACRYFZ_09540 [Janthinobacterium lividum]
MTEQLAELLADRLRPLPFLERVVGLARPVDRLVQEELEDEKHQTRRTKTPEPLAFPPDTDECLRDERYLLPDQNTASILFFEDQGTVDYQIAPSQYGKESTLRLLGWFNPAKFSDPLPENALLDAITRALRLRVRETAGDYQYLTITATVLPAEAALFSKYTYAADATPLLYPPYKLLGLELKCRYFYQPECPVPDLPTIVDLKRC